MRSMDAQIELNEFIARSADAFATTTAFALSGAAIDSRFSRVGPGSTEGVEEDGRKPARLHGDWFHRASSVRRLRRGRSGPVGEWSPENADANRPAWCGRSRRSFVCVRRMVSMTK